MLPDLTDIQKKRRKIGITQKALAIASQTSQSMIAKIEASKIIPSYDIAKRIFAALDALEKKDHVSVEKIMTANIIGISRKDKLVDAIRLMRRHNVSQIPVFGKEDIAGSISEQTITDLTLVEDMKKAKKLPVETFMDAPFPKVGEGTPISIIASLLHYNQAVIITKKSKISGIVTKADLMNAV